MHLKKNLRVLFFSNSHQWNYEDRLLYNLLLSLTQKNIETILICPDQSSIAAKLAKSTVKVHPIPYAYGHGPFIWKQVYSAWSLIKQHRPDVFHLIGRESLYPWSLLLNRRPEIAYFVSLWSNSMTSSLLGTIPFWQRPVMTRIDGVMIAHRDDELFFSDQLKLPSRKIFPYLPAKSVEPQVSQPIIGQGPDINKSIGIYVPRELLDENHAKETILRTLSISNDYNLSVLLFIDEDITGSYLTDGLNKLVQKYSVQSRPNQVEVVGFQGAIPPMERVGIWLSLFTPKEGPDLLALEAWQRQLRVIAPRRDGSMVHYHELINSPRFYTYQQWDLRELRQILDIYVSPAAASNKVENIQRFENESVTLLIERYRRAVAKRGRFTGRHSLVKPL